MGRVIELKTDGTMTDRSPTRLLTIKGSGTWKATGDTLTWTETTVQVGGAPEGVSTSALEESFKTPNKFLYTMADRNTMKLTSSDGFISTFVRVPND
jgi:hypothetical protein